MELDHCIRQANKRAIFAFATLWVLVILLVGLFELELLPTGLLVGEVRIIYYLQTIGILLALGLIPGALKLFHVQLRKIRQLPPQQAVRSYLSFYVLRIAALGVPALFNLILYYYSLDTASAFVTLITMMATVFCLPGEARMREELQFDKPTNTQEE